MSLAAETRAAVRARPFLFEGLRAGVVNYAAAARVIDVSSDTEAVATALRRFADALPPRAANDRPVRVTMHGGLERDSDSDSPLLVVGDTAYADGGDGLTGVLVTGDVDVAALGHTLGVLGTHGIDAEAAGVAGDALVVIVDRRDGPETVQRVEEALADVPEAGTG